MYGLHLNNRNNQRNAGNVPQVNVAGQNAVQAPPPFGAHGAGEAGAALGFQPYIRPPMFVFRVSKQAHFLLCKTSCDRGFSSRTFLIEGSTLTFCTSLVASDNLNVTSQKHFN